MMLLIIDLYVYVNGKKNLLHAVIKRGMWTGRKKYIIWN